MLYGNVDEIHIRMRQDLLFITMVCMQIRLWNLGHGWMPNSQMLIFRQSNHTGLIEGKLDGIPSCGGSMSRNTLLPVMGLTVDKRARVKVLVFTTIIEMKQPLDFLRGMACLTRSLSLRVSMHFGL